MKKLLKFLHTPMWLFLLLCLILVLRIPSFFEPYSYGDEMIYLALGEAIRQGVPLYSGIHDNKPPLLYILAAISGSLFWFKAILAIWNLITIFVFWKLTETLFPKKEGLQKIATFIFAVLTTVPLFEGNIVNSELFMIGLTILGFYLLLKNGKKRKKLTPKIIFTAGLLFSGATLFKIPAAFDVPAIIFLWIVSFKKYNSKNIKSLVKNSFVLCLGFSAPILATFVWYFIKGAFSEYLVAAFLQNVGYLSSWRPDVVREPFLVKNAPLLARTGIVAVGHVILFVLRKKLSKAFIFSTSWLLLSLFAVTLSERPYPHYLIQAIPTISILAAMLFSLQTYEQVLVIIPLTIASIVPVYFNFWYYPTSSYYARFFNFATGALTKDDYLSSFGSSVIGNYKIANYIASITSRRDRVFVWGDGVQIYALSRRLPPIKYVADYHIKDFSSAEDIVAELKNNLPEIIIILPGSHPPRELISLIRQSYLQIETIENAQIWSLITPTARAKLL